ncbi:TPA: MFS transporter [bacterium]|nr:MFS transporter [bacterium]
MILKSNHKVSLTLFLIISLLMHLANYLVIPILPIFLSVYKKIDPFLISVIISVNLILLEIGSLLGGILSDKLNHKFVIALGSSIHAIGMFVFSIMSNYYLLLIFWGLSGFGHGILAPTIKCSINDLCDNDETKQKAFSYRGIFANIGVGIAALIILLGLANYQYLIFIIASIILSLIFVLSFFIKNNHKESKSIKLKDYFTILKNRTLLFFGIIILIINFGYAQLSFLLPLKLDDLNLAHIFIGLIWLIMSIEVISFQNLITNKVINRFNVIIVLFIAMLSFSLGVFFIGLSNTIIILIVGSIIFTIGQMLITPSIDSTVGKISDSSSSGLFYSIAHLLHGLGQALGTSFSGLIISNFNLSFISFLIITFCLLALSILIFLFRKIKIEASTQP